MLAWLMAAVRPQSALHVMSALLPRMFSESAEEALIYLLATWATTGIWGQGIPETIYDDLYVVQAGQRQRAGLLEPVPAWGEARDRRFEGSWAAYMNMGQMLERYGRLDPDDEGVLLQTKDGVWKPIVREEEGIYLVQSEDDPFRYYEVSLPSQLCNCEDHQRRGTICKHQVHARAWAEARLPFEVV